MLSDETKNKISLNNSIAKKVIDTETQKVYNSAKEVSRIFNINYSTLAGKLNGSKNNNTCFRYL